MTREEFAALSAERAAASLWPVVMSHYDPRRLISALSDADWSFARKGKPRLKDIGKLDLHDAAGASVKASSRHSEVREDMPRGFPFEQPCQHCGQWGLWATWNRSGPICSACLGALYMETASNTGSEQS